VRAIAAYAQDRNEYLSSTSGGASHCLAELVIDQGGVVYGCAFLPGVKIEHIRIDKTADLHRIKGSKYVQSKSHVVYNSLIQDVKSGRKVLFLGTPCQCAAVKSLFPNKPENLLLVDIVCHGVPSVDLLKKHLISKIKNISAVNRLTFRQNTDYHLKAYDDKGTLLLSEPLSTGLIDDGYLGPFFYGFTFRNSCYTCQFACPERCTDITIGDFWGLGKMLPEVTLAGHSDGVSVVLANTQLGQIYADALSSKMYMEDRPVNEAICGNDQLRHPKAKKHKIKLFDALRPIIGVKAAYYCVTVPIRLVGRILSKLQQHHSNQ